MKSKPPANCFLQLLAHREKGRLRLVAWALVRNAGRLGVGGAHDSRPSWVALPPPLRYDKAG